jgi:hypothetical protein
MRKESDSLTEKERQIVEDHRRFIYPDAIKHPLLCILDRVAPKPEPVAPEPVAPVAHPIVGHQAADHQAGKKGIFKRHSPAAA